MKTVVCIKRTPDTEARIRLGEAGGSIDPEGVKFIVSPYDEFALEAALQTKEAAGDGEVSLLSMGGDETKETLRQGLAMGADEAVLLVGDTGLDGLATAKALDAAGVRGVISFSSRERYFDPDQVVYGRGTYGGMDTLKFGFTISSEELTIDVPVPGTLALFGLGLLGLSRIRRSK